MLKKIILRFKERKAEKQKMMFWRHIAIKQKINRLGKELNAIEQGNFKELHRIAQQQQNLLTKNGKNL